MKKISLNDAIFSLIEAGHIQETDAEAFAEHFMELEKSGSSFKDSMVAAASHVNKGRSAFEKAAAIGLEGELCDALKIAFPKPDKRAAFEARMNGVFGGKTDARDRAAATKQYGLPHRSGPTRMLGSASVSSDVMPPFLCRAG